jgi:hypothetical protein
VLLVVCVNWLGVGVTGTGNSWSKKLEGVLCFSWLLAEASQGKGVIRISNKS